MVPPRLLDHMNMYDTILAAVRHLFPRSTEATSLCTLLEAHVLVLCAICLVLALGIKAMLRFCHTLAH